MKRVCKICGNDVKKIFDANILNKYMVEYFKCHDCEFIQTEEPFWLEAAYASPIAFLDVGLLFRNNTLAQIVPSIFDVLDGPNAKYLDYGGGYGVFVRLMRDKGYNFFLSDKYAKNLFAQYFELKDAGVENRFTCLTAFELFEHLVNPIEEIKEMFKFSDTVLFSTELQPVTTINSIDDWWYFVPEGGQHVSLYSLRSLEQLKEHFKCYLYSNKINLHILSKKSLQKDPFETKIIKPISFQEKLFSKFFKPKQTEKSPVRTSLLQKDFIF